MNEYEKTLNIDFRKDFGIFYSPNILTNYIIGECLESYFSNQGFDLITLQQITILDCSCGAGAFLLETFDFLLKKYQNYFPNFPEPEKWIIENNLFGVDIDENAVEICKRQFFEKSGFEIQNIKIGNSLIEDKNIDEKAFVWKNEFPLPFKKGGFDLIVGNPPYVTTNKSHKLNKYYQWNTDLYLMFFEVCFKKLLKPNAILSFITPRFWLVNKINQDFRNFMLKEINIWQLVETSPFTQANVECIITFLENTPSFEDKIQIKEEIQEKFYVVNTIKKSFFLKNGSNEILTLLSENKIEILNKIQKNTIYLGDISESKRGMEIGKNDLRIIKKGAKTLIGQDVMPYKIHFEDVFVSVDNKEYKRLEKYFDKKLVFLRRVANRLIATLTNEIFAFNKNLYGINLTDEQFNTEYILSLLNSKVLDFYYKNKFSLKKIDIFPEIQTYLFEALPIKKIDQNQQKVFVQKAKEMLVLNSGFQNTKYHFLELLTEYTKNKKLSKKLENWFTLDWVGFVKELEKAKIEMSLKVKKEWLEMFKDEKLKVNSIAEKIEILDKEINYLVYELYELNEEEIKIIENE